jgi:hypothetical protein
VTRKLIVAAVVVVGLVLIWSLVSWQPIDSGQEADSQLPVADPAPTEPNPFEPAAPTPPKAAPVPAPDPAPAPAAPAPTAETPTVPETATSNGTAPWPVPEKGGPVAEYKNQFEGEPIDSHAVAAESAIQTGFAGPAVHPALLESVLCHTLVCRVRMRWTQERAVGFMGGLMHVVTDPLDNVQFENNLAIDQPQEPNAAGERTVDVYLRMKAPVAR